MRWTAGDGAQELGERRPLTAVHGGAALSAPVLVERDHEVELLLDTVLHPPALVVVEGEAGVGKTRLIAEVLRSRMLGGRRILLGRCQPLSEALTLGPVVEALRSAGEPRELPSLPALTAVLHTLLPEWERVFPARTPGIAERPADRHVVFRALREVLARLAPAVLVLEDLHWADDLTVDFVRFLVPTLPPGLSLVVTMRREDLPERSRLLRLGARVAPETRSAVVRVTPLPRTGVRRLIAALLAIDTVSDEFAGLVHERTAGIPLAVEEVVRLMQDRRDVLNRKGTWIRRQLEALEVPRAIADAVRERAALLSPEARSMVEAAAVFGVPTTEALLAAVAHLPEDEAWSALSEALEAALLFDVDQAGYWFRHALAAQAVHDAIPLPRRRRLHHRAATELEMLAPPPAARLARHHREADQRPQWAHWAEQAGNEAAVRGDDAAAAYHFADALRAPGVPAEDRGRLGVRLAWAATVAAEPEYATQIRAVVDDPDVPAPTRGEARLHLSVLTELVGDASLCYAEKVRAIEELHERPALQAYAMISAADPVATEPPVGECLRLLQRGVEAAERSGDAHTLVLARVSDAAVRLFVGERSGWRAADAIPAAARSLEQERELAWGYVMLTGATCLIGRYSHAAAYAAEALRRAEAARYWAIATELEPLQLILDEATGRWDGLEQRALRFAETHADITRRAVLGWFVVGAVARARGRRREAEAAYRAGLERSAAANFIVSMAGAAAGLAGIHLLRGEPDAAWGIVSPVVDSVTRKGIWVLAQGLLPTSVESLVALRRLDEADALVMRFAHGLRRLDAPAARAGLCLARAHLASARGDVPRAIHHFGRAERAYAALPRPYDAALAGMKRGELLLAAGDPTAVEALTHAMEAFAVLGAADEAHVRQVLRRHGVVLQARWRGGRKGYGDRLSPREEQVLELAAQGRTNDQIGQLLYISPRTVEKHVASGMQKLGVGSRVALAATWHSVRRG